jgi:hypothetical protein
MFARSRRYRHLTDKAPCRIAVRTQSIAVSPPPMTTTRLPLAFSSPSVKLGDLVAKALARFDAVR